MRYLVTGGAGFIGSHLVDALMERGDSVVVVDDLSSGSLNNISKWLNAKEFKFIKQDLSKNEIDPKIMNECDIVLHLAANPEVRISSVSPDVHFKQNVLATFNVLESLRKHGGIKKLLFTSSSTVYGEAEKIPTPEDYSPMTPISVYGASKLACEALITAYANIYGFQAIIARLANVIGSRSRHGVIYDFIKKLRRDPKKLEILGDGTQSKSYFYITDCVEALLLLLEKASDRVSIYNVGSEDRVDAKTIAEVVVREMGLSDVKLHFTGGVHGGRGWAGDVKVMQLDISRIKRLGWRPKYTSYQAVELATRDLINEI
ncbi:MAG: UDP-glucose 4-epimerase [Candidatus Methanomethylicota archaeon]|uniref:UDP-glucose 4-epimerase n=1 Tax=Thermoproteota archaeon TaxID=2056631 RepID=A0A497F1X3_9CREN|nr:MAG: UDP-glucose 4-epimerase [Candidatus Verstraetearchaeota archaeon]RLE53485.1 MAG: UDP-glucose 4-epimerase [Candidatus Verstraetearchaeota archaeon]